MTGSLLSTPRGDPAIPPPLRPCAGDGRSNRRSDPGGLGLRSITSWRARRLESSRLTQQKPGRQLHQGEQPQWPAVSSVSVLRARIHNLQLTGFSREKASQADDLNKGPSPGVRWRNSTPNGSRIGLARFGSVCLIPWRARSGAGCVPHWSVGPARSCGWPKPWPYSSHGSHLKEKARHSPWQLKAGRIANNRTGRVGARLSRGS